MSLLVEQQDDTINVIHSNAENAAVDIEAGCVFGSNKDVTLTLTFYSFIAKDSRTRLLFLPVDTARSAGYAYA